MAGYTDEAHLSMLRSGWSNLIIAITPLIAVKQVGDNYELDLV